MLVFSWIIRGLGLPTKKQAVRDFCHKYNPSILALTETKMHTTLQQVR
ncbi:hypothetical protein AMTRI_Chr01g137740 [Amborella trichopoda]